MRKSLSLVLTMVLLIGIVSIGSASSLSGPIPTQTSRTTFNIGVGGEVTSLDPAMSKDAVTPTGWMYLIQLYDPLLKYDQETREFVPALATEWEISEDATEVLFTLREGVRFHNGDIMTADDVVFSLNRALNAPYTSSVNGSIDRFEKVDDTHVKVVLKFGYVPILQVLDVPCWGIVSKRAVEEAEAAGIDFGRNPVGTGPYTLKNWKSGESFEFGAFEEHWEGAPVIKTVNVFVMPDQSAGALALEDGSIDHYPTVPKTEIEYFKTLDNLKVVELSGGSIYDITFNVTDGPFTNKKLRQAVAYALDYEELLIGGQEGYGTVAKSICSPKAVGYIEDPEPFAQDLEKAKLLMAEAGYPNGLDVTLTQDSSPTYMPLAEVVQAQLKKIGINATFEKMERSAWFDKVGNNREFQASVRMTTFSLFDADYIFSRRFTEAALGGGNNYSGYHTPELEALIDQARREPNPEKRLEIYRKAYAIIKEDVPLIPLINYADFLVFNSKLQGMREVTGQRNTWNRLYFVD